MVNAELSSSPEPETSGRLENHQHQGLRAEDTTAEPASIFSLNVEAETEILVGVSLRSPIFKLKAFSKACHQSPWFVSDGVKICFKIRDWIILS